MFSLLWHYVLFTASSKVNTHVSNCSSTVVLHICSCTNVPYTITTLLFGNSTPTLNTQSCVSVKSSQPMKPRPNAKRHSESVDMFQTRCGTYSSLIVRMKVLTFVFASASFPFHVWWLNSMSGLLVIITEKRAIFGGKVFTWTTSNASQF